MGIDFRSAAFPAVIHKAFDGYAQDVHRRLSLEDLFEDEVVAVEDVVLLAQRGNRAAGV